MYIINIYSIHVTYNALHVGANAVASWEMTRVTPYTSVLGRRSLHGSSALDHLTVWVYSFVPRT